MLFLWIHILIIPKMFIPFQELKNLYLYKLEQLPFTLFKICMEYRNVIN